MSKIRLADIPDVDEICVLGSELLEQSVYAWFASLVSL